MSEVSIVRPHDPLLWLAGTVAVLVNGVTWSVWVATQAPGALAVAVVTQLLGALAMATVTERARRALAVTLAAAVPVVGPLAVVLLVQARGKDGLDLLHDPHARAPRLDALAIARRLTTSLPSCEAIMSGDVDARRATLARLTARARPDDVAILRWARGHDDPEVAVEVALAFEELGQRFEQRLRDARDAAAAEPTASAHAQIVHAISAGITSGVVDATLVSRLAEEARRHHVAAAVLDPSLARVLVAPRARIELAACRPTIALAQLEAAIRRSPDPELLELYAQAAYAARRFELAPAYAPWKRRHAA